MKAVLNATGFSPELMPLIRHRPTPLFRVVDKPVIVHVIEFLAHHGIQKVELVLSHLPEQIEEILEEGSRWGIKITYHLSRDPLKPFTILGPAAGGWKDALVLLGRADILPPFNPQKLRTSGHTKPLLLYNHEQEWTGWGLVSPGALSRVPPDVSYDSLPDYIGEHHRQLTKDPVMKILTFGGWQQANNALIQQRTSSAVFPSSSRMVESGVWLSRATTIHPTAVVTAPAFIGDNCQILEGAVIGPNAVIENHCIVDRETTIENSIVCQRSYVGKGLEIRDSIIDRNTLINLSLETAVKISNDFILANLQPPPLSQQLFAFSERLIALAILLVLAPVLFPMVLLWHLKTTSIAKLPILKEYEPWPTFQLFSFERPESWIAAKVWNYASHLPALANVVKGELHFVGIHPLTIDQLERLLPDWQPLYHKTKVGLIALTDVDYTEQPSESERFASETYYAAHEKVRFDLHILVRWLGKQLSLK